MNKGQLLDKVDEVYGRYLPEGGVEELTEIVFPYLYDIEYDDEVLTELIKSICKKHKFKKSIGK